MPENAPQDLTDGGVGDYLLRNDKIEAVILAIGTTGDFQFDFFPGNLAGRGILVDIGTRGDRNDQFDELHQILNLDPFGGAIEYFGQDRGLPEPSFQSDQLTASVTVHGFAALRGFSTIAEPKLRVTTTYSVTVGNAWIDISTVVTNIGPSAAPIFSVADIDLTAGKNRMPFQPFPGLGEVPNPGISLRDLGRATKHYAQWDYMMMLGTNGPEDGPANNDGTPAGGVCYGYMPVAMPPAAVVPLVGLAFNQFAIASSFFDLDSYQDLSLLPGADLRFDRRLVVGNANTVDSCLETMLPLLYGNAGVTVQGRVVDGGGEPVDSAHVFFANTVPGSGSYPALLATTPGSPLPVTHTVTDSDGRFTAHLPRRDLDASYTCTVKAPERTRATAPFDVPAGSIEKALGDVVLSQTGNLNFTVQRRLPGGGLAATPVRLTLYGTNGTKNPDFGTQ